MKVALRPSSCTEALVTKMQPDRSALCGCYDRKASRLLQPSTTILMGLAQHVCGRVPRVLLVVKADRQRGGERARVF